MARRASPRGAAFATAGRYEGGLPRVTEQGEMIASNTACRSHRQQPVALHQHAILEANLLPPPEPKDSQRHIMDDFPSSPVGKPTAATCAKIKTLYRTSAPRRRNKSWSKLPLGSRPAKRRQLAASNRCARFRGSSRTQNRLITPAAGRGVLRCKSGGRR